MDVSEKRYPCRGSNSGSCNMYRRHWTEYEIAGPFFLFYLLSVAKYFRCFIFADAIESGGVGHSVGDW